MMSDWEVQKVLQDSYLIRDYPMKDNGFLA